MQVPRRFHPCRHVALWSVILLLLASGAAATTVQLSESYPVTSPSTIDYRWSDVGQNVYAQSYRDAYSYADAIVTVTFAPSGQTTFTGHLSAANLKPNFAYQLKLVGKPEALFDPLTEGGDDWSNERIGYAGRWWETAPGSGNRVDSYYETYKDNPAYVFEAYLLFDFFMTDATGAAELDFALDSSYHVLFWQWQGAPGSCDQPMKTTTVTGSAADPAYDTDVGPRSVGVYPQIERLCNGQTVLQPGNYKCRILLTEESFHTQDGNWAPAMINDDVEFGIGVGLFPPSLQAEPAYTAGTDNTVAWNTVAAATLYFVQCATDAGFTAIADESGWISGVSHQFGGLADGQAYHYRVKAGDGMDESAWSGARTSVQDATAPTSSVGALPASHEGFTLSIPWSAADATSGIKHVLLYARADAAPYQQYGGIFTSSPITFLVPADGDYDFYTVAVDHAGNQETPPAAPDASCTLTRGETPDPDANPEYVDIGTLATEGQSVMGEAPHNMVGWGPTAPGTIGGGYGGIAPNSCRPVWSPTEFDLPHEPWADIDLNFGPEGGVKTLWVRYLDGASTDDQSYFINGTLIGSIETGDPGENWYWHSFDVSDYAGYNTLRILATEPAGYYWNPYGQVAIDIITICGAAALFAAVPVDDAPIACGESKQVDVHFTRGCEFIRGYSVRVRGSGGLGFDGNDVTVHDPSGTGAITTTVTQNAPDDWTVSYEIVGNAALPFGIPSDVDLFSIDVQGAAAGTGQLTIESVTVNPLRLAPPPVIENVDAAITVICGGPGAATDLAAAPGNRKVVVTWRDPAAADIAAVEVWRGLWHDGTPGSSAYPEYDDLAGDVTPTRPGSRAEALASPQWELAGTVPSGEESYTDVNGVDGLARGVYWYEVFPRDVNGYYGPPATTSDRSTSYLLGDLDGDGDIKLTTDISGGLALCYGTAHGESGYDNACDVGPTDDWSGSGIPATDSVINFGDLMIFALNYDITVTKSQPPAGTPDARFAWERLDARTWALTLLEPCRNLKGLRLHAELPPGAVTALVAGALLEQQSEPWFLQNIPARGLDAGLAVLGGGVVVTGPGELMQVQLNDAHDLRQVAIEARGADNSLLPHTLELVAGAGDEVPGFAAPRNRPNPFNPSTTITFTLPERLPVRLAVYDVNGRQVVTLAKGMLPAGPHAFTWDGRNDHGKAVASGLYFCRLTAGTRQETSKMTLVR
ncbi:MAG: FlgD immunoglobulin-like domain containing protein [Candidatus Latescibacteria bacterium]|nr:FlgD immunoglobulin-like domain containing protein [Candidatus Latescibacterota bacterium]